MTDKPTKLPDGGKGAAPDARRRALLKGAIKGAAIGAPMVMTLKTGQAWARSCLPGEAPVQIGGAPNNPAVPGRPVVPQAAAEISFTCSVQ